MYGVLVISAFRKCGNNICLANGRLNISLIFPRLPSNSSLSMFAIDRSYLTTFAMCLAAGVMCAFMP